MSLLKRDCISAGRFKLQCLALKIIFGLPWLGAKCSSLTPMASLAPQKSASLNETIDPSPRIAQSSVSTAVILKAMMFQRGTTNKLFFHCFLSNLYIDPLLCFVVTSRPLHHLPVKLLTRNDSIMSARRKNLEVDSHPRKILQIPEIILF